jgi:hypothetical protein
VVLAFRRVPVEFPETVPLRDVTEFRLTPAAAACRSSASRLARPTTMNPPSTTSTIARSTSPSNRSARRLRGAGAAHITSGTGATARRLEELRRAPVALYRRVGRVGRLLASGSR